MIKYIWECGSSPSCIGNVLYKNKLTVVYENKEFYYCKINGSNSLRCIERSLVKNCINNPPKQPSKIDGYYSYDIDISNQSVSHEIIQAEERIMKLKSAIKDQRRRIEINSQSNKQYEQNILWEEKQIVGMEKHIVALKAKRTTT